MTVRGSNAFARFSVTLCAIALLAGCGGDKKQARSNPSPTPSRATSSSPRPSPSPTITTHGRASPAPLPPLPQTCTFGSLTGSDRVTGTDHGVTRDGVPDLVTKARLSGTVTDLIQTRCQGGPSHWDGGLMWDTIIDHET